MQIARLAKIVVILLIRVLKDDGKFYPQTLLEEALLKA